MPYRAYPAFLTIVAAKPREGFTKNYAQKHPAPIADSERIEEARTFF
jgi:hypothetical protein